ncbi:MAG: hypothetical protein MUC60_11490 [Oscillatoria sp. Prado101]|nr:hypothetical protein [Oscillatoria sp. Prado101]
MPVGVIVVKFSFNRLPDYTPETRFLSETGFLSTSLIRKTRFGQASHEKPACGFSG